MEMQFSSYEKDFGSELKCPKCGDNYLHHGKVEIFERGEDQERGLHVTVEDGVAITDTDLSGNPSKRRHGIAIHLWCENCKAESVLSISQHKGNTWINIK